MNSETELRAAQTAVARLHGYRAEHDRISAELRRVMTPEPETDVINLGFGGHYEIPDRFLGRRVRVTLSDPAKPLEHAFVVELIAEQSAPIAIPTWARPGQLVAIHICVCD